MDAKRKRYFSVGLPGSGLSYRTFFGHPVTAGTLKRIGYSVAILIGLGVLAVVATRK
jgi:hypothetical protein